jgi:hypothetical protein
MGNSRLRSTLYIIEHHILLRMNPPATGVTSVLFADAMNRRMFDKPLL